MGLFKKKQTDDSDVSTRDDVGDTFNSLVDDEAHKKSGFKFQLQRILKKLKLDSHHTIERFGVIVGVFAVVGVFLLGSAIVSVYKNAKDDIADTAIYNANFVTSRTEVKGSFVGVYTDPSKTRTMVMLSPQEASFLPSNAEDYEVFVVGTDTNLQEKSVAHKPLSGRYVTFGGDSKYMGVVLDNPEGFDLQLYDVVIRINREVTSKDAGLSGPSKKTTGGDRSFEQFDQIRFVFNPGANGAEILDVLGKAGEEFKPGDVYHQVVTKAEEEKIRSEMDDQLGVLRRDLARIDQYEKQMLTTSVDDRGTRLKLNKVDTPKVIAGDKVTGQDAKEAKDGNSSLTLNSKTIIPGGYDFDWRAGDIKKGYLDQVVPEGMSYVEFMQRQAEVNAVNPNWDEVEFTLNNKKSLSFYSNRDSFMRPLLDLRTNLISAWQSYYEDKRDYQVKSYNKLLELEIELRNVETNTVQNTDSDKFKIF